MLIQSTYLENMSKFSNIFDTFIFIIEQNYELESRHTI